MDYESAGWISYVTLHYVTRIHIVVECSVVQCSVLVDQEGSLSSMQLFLPIMEHRAAGWTGLDWPDRTDRLTIPELEQGCNGWP